MADIKSSEARSQNMSRIKSKDTKPEVWFRKELFKQGYRYRKNVNYITGHPDAWLAKYNTVIFVNGCFWHRHSGCKYAYMPKSRVTFWENKFRKNIERDKVVRCQLRDKGYRILIIWECTIKTMVSDDTIKENVLDKVDDFMHSEECFLEL